MELPVWRWKWLEGAIIKRHCSFLPCQGCGAGSPSYGGDLGQVLSLFWSLYSLLFAKIFLIQYYHNGFQPRLPIRIAWAFKKNMCPSFSLDQWNQCLWGWHPGIRNFQSSWEARMENHWKWNMQFQRNKGNFKIYFNLKLFPLSSSGLEGGHGKLLLLTLQVFSPLPTCSPKLLTALWLACWCGRRGKGWRV